MTERQGQQLKHTAADETLDVIEEAQRQPALVVYRVLDMFSNTDELCVEDSLGRYMQELAASDEQEQAWRAQLAAWDRTSTLALSPGEPFGVTIEPVEVW